MAVVRGGPIPVRTLRFLGGWLAVMAAVLFAVGSAFTAPLSISDHASSVPFGVDYLAFDSAGSLVREGRSRDLYDVATQQRTQSERSGASGSVDVQYFEFLYPPPVAAAFAPLSALPVGVGYLAFTLLLLLALAVAGGLILHLTSASSTTARVTLAACALGSTATFVSLLVGQLTPLLVLAMLGAMASVRAQRPVMAGVLLGLLCVKPHFAIAALIIGLAARQRRTAQAMLVTGGLMAIASVLLVGPDGARGYADLTRSVARDPGALGASVGAEQNVFGLARTLFGVHGGAALAWSQTAIGLIALALVWRAARAAAYEGTDRLMYLFALGAMLVLVASPHVQYYDLALLLFPAMFVVQRRATADPPLARALTGVLMLSVIFVEGAGMLASLGASLSAPFLLAMLSALCGWPRVERALSATATLAPEREASLPLPRAPLADAA